MGYIALRNVEMRDGSTRHAGEPIPEAAGWDNPAVWMRAGDIALVTDGKEDEFCEGLKRGIIRQELSANSSLGHLSVASSLLAAREAAQRAEADDAAAAKAAPPEAEAAAEAPPEADHHAVITRLFDGGATLVVDGATLMPVGDAKPEAPHDAAADTLIAAAKPSASDEAPAAPDAAPEPAPEAAPELPEPPVPELPVTEVTGDDDAEGTDDAEEAGDEPAETDAPVDPDAPSKPKIRRARKAKR